MTDVTRLAASYATGTPSDLNGAIRRAADSFNQTRSLKVIVVLSNGLFVVNSTTFPSAALKKNQVKLMVYNLPSNDDGGDTFLLKTPFQKDICSVQGSFELLNAVATANPLYSMRSYFNYLARIQLSAVGGKVTWSNTYASVSQSLYRLSATYPAFGSDGLLIGVAGTDVVLDSLDEPLRTLVLQAVSSRVRGTMQATANISMTCSYQINTPANSSCPGSTLPDSSAICPRNDFTSSLADRTCCGTCGSGENSGLKAGIIAGILIAGLAASFVLIVVAGICYKVRAGNRWKPRSFLPWWEPISFLPVEVDFLNLCELVVHSIEILVNRGTLLNGRQCLDLSSKLSKTTQNVREIVFHCRASAVLFKPALEKLYRDLQKAYFLVNDCSCREEDWCRASVFQIQNEISFRVILLDVGLCYNEIYEQARSTTSEEMNFPEDLRNSSVFMPSPQNVVREDQLDLQKGLEARASGRSGSLEECLAKYLVAKLNHTYDPSKTNAFSTCNSILWSDESGPSEIWGNSHFLGAGSGASGVCSTKWMGIPCAKKEFHLKESEPFFLNEASILAHLKHPGIVNFICCGNGEQKGDRFIAMELMERNLCDLIEDQRGVYFSLFAVVDIMIQIARGMCYLHSQGIAHRDLKPQKMWL
ncbi:hypothetical protein M758_8G093500 [Ceratodon purpureus]|nr:hypothetical protein M758_8G093500 [Ceratodon purpureus]